MPVVNASPERDIDVAVIGAGAAGLAAARRIMAGRPDLRVLVIEAAARIGGRAHTIEAAGCPVDLGCGWLHGARTNAWKAQAESLGFTVDRTPAPWDGGGRELGLPALEQADSQAAQVRFFARVEAHPADAPDAPMTTLLEPGNRWNRQIDAVCTYMNGIELDEASIRDYQHYDPGPSPDWRVRDGYGRLVARYGEPAPVMLETAVRRIDHSGREAIRLETARGDLRARAAIVAVPTDAIAREGLRFDPPLPDKIAAAAALPLGFAEKLFLHLDRPEEFPAEGHLLGTPFSVATGAYHIRPFGRPVIECYLAGHHARTLAHAGRDAAMAFAIEELSAHFGSAIRDRLSFAALSAWTMDPLIGGSYAYARPGRTDRRAVLAAPVDGRLFFAGEAVSPQKFSTAHGAFESGLAAAEAAMAAL